MGDTQKVSHASFERKAMVREFGKLKFLIIPSSDGQDHSIRCPSGNSL